MRNVVFRYQTLLPSSTIAAETLFAECYPAEASWLRRHAAEARIGVYRWPEFITRYVCDRLGMTVYDFDVSIEQPIGEQFGRVFDKRWACDEF